MRRPIAVGGRRTYPAHTLAGFDRLTHGQPIQRGAAEMAVKGVEGCAFVGGVAQENHRTVVQARPVVMEGMDDAVQRRVDRRIGRRKEVDAQVHCAPFAGGAVVGGKGWAGVDGARLIVTADADRGARPLHVGPNRRGEGGRVVLAQQLGRQQLAADGEVEHAHRRAAQIIIQDRSQLFGLAAQERYDRRRLRAGWQSTRNT